MFHKIMKKNHGACCGSRTSKAKSPVRDSRSSPIVINKNRSRGSSPRGNRTSKSKSPVRDSCSSPVVVNKIRGHGLFPRDVDEGTTIKVPRTDSRCSSIICHRSRSHGFMYDDPVKDTNSSSGVECNCSSHLASEESSDLTVISDCASIVTSECASIVNSDCASVLTSDLCSVPSTAVVKYKKTACLFCKEWIDSQKFTEHLVHCGQVFVTCPNGCSAYVTRVRLPDHLLVCPRAEGLQLVPQSCSDLQCHFDKECVQAMMEQDIDALRVVLNDEIRQRLNLRTDVGNLRKQNQATDDWMKSAQLELNNVRKRLEEEFAQRCFEMEQCQQDFRYSYDMLQTLKNEVQHKIFELQKHIDKMLTEMTNHQNLLNENIVKLENTLVRSEDTNDMKFQQMYEFLQRMAKDFNTKCVATADLCVQQESINYEMKGVKTILCETGERCEKLESLMFDLDKRLCHTMQGLNDLENHVATTERLCSIENARGHLIWRITDYAKKLREAKRYDTVIHSPIFSDRQYGYFLRLDIHLNGKGHRQGRNMLAAINVIPGEYDPLLAWPCRLQGDIIIRDQCTNSEYSEDYVKTINVRRKSDECYQTNQFFNIPHKVINSHKYIRNDCLFVEVKVHKC